MLSLESIVNVTRDLRGIIKCQLFLHFSNSACYIKNFITASRVE